MFTAFWISPRIPGWGAAYQVTVINRSNTA